MPASWPCHMIPTLAKATGWHRVVAFVQSGAISVYGYLYAAEDSYGNGYSPSAGESLNPVCAKMGP